MDCSTPPAGFSICGNSIKKFYRNAINLKQKFSVQFYASFDLNETFRALVEPPVEESKSLNAEDALLISVSKQPLSENSPSDGAVVMWERGDLENSTTGPE